MPKFSLHSKPCCTKNWLRSLNKTTRRKYEMWIWYFQRSSVRQLMSFGNSEKPSVLPLKPLKRKIDALHPPLTSDEQRQQSAKLKHQLARMKGK